ncbi:MAG TPA: hypothetical protein VN864_07370 [Thermoplasmata archaeon]|nr:hypothetical protein [Thermoplasmata archaeon]
MSGIFRRFRRPKPKEEDDEPSDAPEGEAGEESDIYPNRPFERPGDPDIEGEPKADTSDDDEDDAVAGPPVIPEEIGPAAPEPSLATRPEVPSPPTPSTPESAPDVAAREAPTGPRPPLPEADAGAGRSVHRPLNPPTRCFLCGTEMTGSFCPTCRMTWND